MGDSHPIPTRRREKASEDETGLPHHGLAHLKPFCSSKRGLLFAAKLNEEVAAMDMRKVTTIAIISN
jgi:hypothetical protein